MNIEILIYIKQDNYLSSDGILLHHVLWRIQKLNFSHNSSIKCTFILCGTSNVYHYLPEEFVNEMILSGIFSKKYFNTIVIFFPLLHRGKKELIRRGNVNIINRLLEEKFGKYNFHFLKYNKSPLNVDESLSINLFYEDGPHLIKEANNFWHRK